MMIEGMKIAETKVSKHQQKHKGHKILSPRIHVTGQKLRDCGFEIDDRIKITYVSKGKIVIENLDSPPE